MNTIKIRELQVGKTGQLVLIAGPCVIESREHCLSMARTIKQIAQDHSIPFIFKVSYDKANRSSLLSYRGPGMSKGLDIIAEVKETLEVPVLSDIHSVEEAHVAGKVLDIIQVPAFLCRQTDIILAAANTGKAINIKKGQFLAPWDIKNIIAKIESTGNKQILLTERGASFGYNYLVSDMRSLVVMREFGYPVIFDATHSVQLPGGKGSSSGGERRFVQHLARAAVAVGVDALFIETHDNPDNALSDASNMINVAELPYLIKQVQAINNVINQI